jgi:hypothetical protein
MKAANDVVLDTKLLRIINFPPPPKPLKTSFMSYYIYKPIKNVCRF